MPATARDSGFFALHANHLEDLRHAVVWLLRQAPLHPLENDAFLVQSNGIAQWLKLALAETGTDNPTAEGGGLGIAAGLEFLFPARFIWQAYRAFLPAGEVPEASPYDKAPLTWRLYRLLPRLIETDPVFSPLQRFLDGPEPEQRRYQLAGRIADLFDQYQVFRADWLARWEQGEDRLVSARGQSRALEAEARWQPALWRALIGDVGEAVPSSRAHIHSRFLAAVRGGRPPAQPEALPPRVTVFGVSSLPRQALEVLHGLSRYIQVVLCVHNPCQYHWADIISDRDLLRAGRKRAPAHPGLSRLADPAALHQHANPLLAAWGKQGRDYIGLLDEFDDPESYRHRLPTPDNRIDIFAPHGPETQPRLLHQIQNDILNLTPVPEIQAEQRRVDASADDSLVFHRAHSPQREVEVLHDQLLAAFNGDPTLRPRDIIVMVPDINHYAPHIQAVFSQHPPGSRRRIPFTISDEGRRHRQPVLIALETLLSLPRARWGASELISLLEVPAVRARFHLPETEVPRVRQWLQEAGVRWGLDAAQRQQLGLPGDLHRNTWEAGVRSLLLGYAMGENGSWGDDESYGEMGGLEAALAGPLSLFLRRLRGFWQGLAERPERSPEEWGELMGALLEDFFDPQDETETLALQRFRQQLEQWLEATETAGTSDQPLPLPVVAEPLLEGLDEGGLNQRFLAGRVNFATLMPMRAIPFRRVCLLGMNDGDYPRIRPPVDFDLMARDYRPGDRSRREDDRYLFLEALLSAREQLSISWVGRSVRDDSPRPPSVLVGQLRDHLDSLWGLENGPTGESVAEALTWNHPLQPFSRDYFPPEPQEGNRALFTYEREWRAALVEDSGRASNRPLAYREPEEPIPLARLAEFLKSPVSTFFQHRLQVRFEPAEGVDPDAEDFALEGLQRWQLEQELIQETVLKAEDADSLQARIEERLERMERRGALGMGVNSALMADSLCQRLPNLHQRYQAALAQWPEPLEVPPLFEWEHGGDLGRVWVSDWIDGLRVNGAGERCRLVVAGGVLISPSGSGPRVRYRNLLGDWVIHLAGQLTGQGFQTCILAREEDRSFRFPPIPADQAATLFNRLLEHWMAGTTEPLPLEARAGFEWLYWYYRSRQKGDADNAGERAASRYEQALEQDSGLLGRVYPEAADLLADGRFIELAEALYSPLLEAESAGQKSDQKRAGS